MNIKKSLLILLTLVFVFSCKQDELLDQNSGQTAGLTADISQYDNSNIGLYKGAFTTLDATERGVLEVVILDNAPSRATLTLVSGASFTLLSTTNTTAGQVVTNLHFTPEAETATNVAFDFSVNDDGSNPRMNNINLGGNESSIIIAKETSRDPVSPVTGSYTCTTCGTHPTLGTTPETFNAVFTGAGTGNDTMTTDITVSGDSFVSSTNIQENCVADTPTAGYTTCDISGTTNFGSPMNWIGTHTYNQSATACSSAAGTWAVNGTFYGDLAGTFVGDVTCIPPPGDTVGTAIPLTGLPAEGSGCAAAAYTVDLSANGGFTDSGTATTCTNGTRDVFYSWTATTDGITFTGLNSSSTTIPLFSVLDATGTTEIACGDGSFGAITLSGWMVNDPLILRVAAGIEIPFCLEEFTVPGVPANDTCATAEAILCGATVMGNTVTATNSDTSRGPDVWYTLDGTTQPASTVVTVSLCGSTYDTWLGVYTDCTFGTLVASSDDFCSAQSELSFVNDGVTNYVIRVDGFSSGDSGAFTLAVTCNPPPPPGPDTCATAAAISCGGTAMGTTVGASDDDGVYGPDEWYLLSGTTNGDMITASLCGGGTNYDSRIVIYDVCGGTEFNNDDFCGVQSEITWMSDGSNYLVSVQAFSTGTGSYQLDITCATPFSNGSNEVINIERAAPNKAALIKAFKERKTK